MIKAIRSGMEGLHLGGERSNLSLLFNRLCPGIDEHGEKDEKERALTGLLGGYSADGCLDLYKDAFKQWRQLMESDPDAICFEMEVSTPMVVGKGDQNVHEFGISLQHPWGTPVIPGSAVKGVLSSFAHDYGGEDWHKGALAARDNMLNPFSGKLSLVMFGGMTEEGEFAGCLDFYDAWWIPAGSGAPFAEDIINVHNRSYYQQENQWPDGTDSPVPNKFAVIRPGEKFFFAIRGVDRWRQLAKDVLVQAADRYGFGAKTRVGYGRLQYVKGYAELIKEIASCDRKRLAELFGSHGSVPELQDSFRAEARKRSFDTEMMKFFRRFHPYRCFLHDLETKKPSTWRDVKNIYEQYKSALKKVNVDRSDPTIQKIFSICHPLVPERNDMPSWMAPLAPSATDYINGRTADEIDKLFENYRQAYPPLVDFKEAIEQSDLDDDEKELLLLKLEELLPRS
ncbi:type III-B CRISPR module RAMP protein Cmr6 [Thermodesulfobacteriota bacterium B35]